MSAPSGRYQRSSRGMIAALVVVVVGVVAYVGIGALLSDDGTSPVPTVDYQGWVRSGRDDGKLQIMVPTPRPAGWRATSVDYTTGNDPRWHLGMLTDHGRYVGIEEQWASPSEMVRQYVDAHPVRGKAVTLAGRTWQAWTDRGGDYAVVSTRPSRLAHHTETVLVVGDAPPATIRRLAASLSAG